MLFLPAFLLGITTVLAAPTCTSTAGSNYTTTLYLSSSTIAGLQLALHLENLEVNFFQSGTANLTSKDSQAISESTRDAIRQAALQERAHQNTLRNILLAADALIIPECEYIFPSKNTAEFLSLGRSLSSVGVGAILSLAEFIASSDPDLVAGIASIASTEARHDAFFNIANGQLPNPSSFDTPISSTWAYNLALRFIVPGSCPVELPIPILPTLNTQETIPSNQTIMEFSWDPTQKPVAQEGGRRLYIGWVSQLGSPIYTPLVSTGNGTGTTTVPSGLGGVIYATLTMQNTFITMGDITGATLAGPAILVVE
ncbi:ferritin-like domain-containing protein [Xylogone sp. PMI_703]|nr:ferritin-like domain-containing protein [Xylogone sp. PMI_703]